MPDNTKFVVIDKRIEALTCKVALIKRAPIFTKAPMVEDAVMELLDVLSLMVAELKVRKPVYCDADWVAYCECGLEVRTSSDNYLRACPHCHRALKYPDSNLPDATR